MFVCAWVECGFSAGCGAVAALKETTAERLRVCSFSVLGNIFTAFWGLFLSLKTSGTFYPRFTGMRSSSSSFSSTQKRHLRLSSSMSLSLRKTTSGGLGGTTRRKTTSSWFGRAHPSATMTSRSSSLLEESGPGYGETPDGGPKKEEVLGLDMALGTMGKTRMVFTDRGWQVDDALVREYEEKLQQLTEQLSEVRWEQQVARASETEAEQEIAAASAATAEEVATLQFKNQLLIEMLAIAQLDESHALQSCDREKIKAEEYRREVERCYGRMLHHGLDPGVTTSSSKKTSKAEKK